MHISPISWRGDIQAWSETWPLKATSAYWVPQDKKELQAFLWIINCFGKFSPSMADICELLRKLKSATTEWSWKATYQKIFDKAKSIIKDACMKFYDETKPLSTETDASEVSWELTCYKQEVVQVALGMKHQATAYSDLFHLWARACQAGKKIEQHTKRINRCTIWPQKVPSLLLCERGEYNHRSQTTHSNIRKKI